MKLYTKGTIALICVVSLFFYTINTNIYQTLYAIEQICQDLYMDTIGKLYLKDRWSNLESRQTALKETSDVTKILVVTYMRSGSSLTAESLQQGPGVSFYSFEPLFNYHTEPVVICNSGNCNVMNRTVESSHFAVSIIKKIFECSFSALPDEVLHTFSKFKQTKYYWIVRDCFPSPEKIKKVTNKETLRSMRANKSKCLSFLESRCRNSTVRVIKTIRLPLHLCKNLLETTDNMKILHLMRDPRATLYSRRSLGLVFTKPEVQEFCYRMLRDVEEGQLIMGSDFPRGLYSLRYECLARNPETVLRKLYKDMSVKYDSETEKWMQRYMKSHNCGLKGFAVFKSDSSSVSTNWRLRIPFKDSQSIDTLCREVYTKIGTRPFKSAKDLENLGIPDMYPTSYTERYCK